MIRSKKEDPKVPASVELEKISYIEDAELNKYILSAKERRFKTALWELINRDYLEEKKTKRDQDGNRSNRGQALPNKVLCQ
ncbi:Brf1-like TBP-binding domain-containing protein [Carex littledalei]|uniref:Brf1-like TBP-binding domain-containing protein n=1 Tax=Carex littledalei TaxID=544730 RepID=A0A833VYW2_9POAL|nr:Brf1-like TBP-binding domain-containing protein [Carex littledalei]